MAKPIKYLRHFPVTSPEYEVCQMRKTSQKSIEYLQPGDIIRFVSGRVTSTRSGDNRALLATYFTLQRLENNKWVDRSVELSQGTIPQRIAIITEGDPYDPEIFENFKKNSNLPWIILKNKV